MMEEHDSTRRIRSRSNNNNTDDSGVVDRISALPDCILGHILSFLNTKIAVTTSLLSKRWKFSWLDVHNLDFYFIPLGVPDSAENEAFIRYVYRVLILTDGRQLKKFSLTWLCTLSSHLVCWIDAAISRNVHEISLCLLGGDIFRYPLPISGFNCDSLRYLRLHNISFVYDTTEVCLPRLETIIVRGVCRFATKETFEKLIDGCPVLHHLEISVFSDDDDPEYKVSSPSLTYLDIHFMVSKCILKLMAPSLEYLMLVGKMSEIYVEKSLSSLVTAGLCIKFDEHDFPHNLIVGVVRALEHAKFLTLSAHVMKALALATTSLSTKFKRLVKFVVYTNCCCYLQDFVHNSENLEELVIYQADWRCSSVPHDHSRWTAPVVIPRCLSKTLKKVRLIGYSGLEDESETIRFMLEHGIALEVVQIRYKNKVDGEKLLKEIGEFPRKSPACKVSTSELYDLR